MQTIELLQELKLIVIDLGCSSGELSRRKQIGNRLLRIRCIERGGLMFGRQKASTPVDDSARGQSAWIGQDDERWQIVRFTAESVRHP